MQLEVYRLNISKRRYYSLCTYIGVLISEFINSSRLLFLQYTCADSTQYIFVEFVERVVMKTATRTRMQGAYFCKYCGTKVSKDAIYCPLCGRPSLLLNHLTELILESL
jgi:hypothetical protein